MARSHILCNPFLAASGSGRSSAAGSAAKAERHTLRVRTIPKDSLDGRDDGGGNSESSSVSEEPAEPKSPARVRQTVYRTEVPHHPSEIEW